MNISPAERIFKVKPSLEPGLHANSSKERWSALDALRGLAALSVACYHIYCYSNLPALLKLPNSADWQLRHAYLGVSVFFVLSGVVMGIALLGIRITWRFAGVFALRRSLRLDPPYWLTLALACAIRTAAKTPPSLNSVIAHVLYLQVILGFHEIVSQFWTLTYEIQFYMVFVVLIATAQKTGKIGGWLAAVVPLLGSVALKVTGYSSHGFFLDWWYAFALGVATTGTLKGRLNLWLWAAFSASVLVLGIRTSNGEMIAAALTALSIGATGRLGKLGAWQGGRVLQHLGRISYSLYLVHFLGSSVAKFGAERVSSRLGGVFVFALALSVAICGAELIYWLVERPALLLSRRYGTKRIDATSNPSLAMAG